MPDAKLAAIIHSPLVEVYALAHDGRDEGLLELDFREAGHCEIVFFGVTAKLIGSGAGRWLMNRALELAWSRPIARLWLHTCTHDHPSAVAFYQRCGLSRLPAADRDRGRSTARRHGAARCGAACADYRVAFAVIVRDLSAVAQRAKAESGSIQ